MSDIADNLQAVLARIARAATAAGRDPRHVRLLAVSKTWPLDCVLSAAEAGQTAFGENYVQEGQEKASATPTLEWHFIGPLQSNKTRAVAEHFAWVHSVDREKIAERLSAQRPADLAPLEICVQVNISGEASKSGCAPAAAAALCAYVATLPRLRLRGLMTIPEASADPAQQRAAFAALRELQQQILSSGLLPAPQDFDTLSMGMSHDLEAAIAEGATLVRVGTAIFGERNYA